MSSFRELRDLEEAIKRYIREYYRILLGFVFGCFVAMLLVGGAGLFGSFGYDDEAATATFAIIGIATLIGIVWHIQYYRNK